VSEEVTITAGSGPRWVRFSVPYTLVFDEQPTIMILSGGKAGVARNYSGNFNRNWWGFAANYDQGPPSDWTGVAVQFGDVTVAVYAE
jgi:hypothetical protein